MPFDRKTLVIPDETVFEEHTIITHGDVVVSDGARIDFGVKTDGRVFVGEHAKITGSVDADGDIHVDMFSEVLGDMKSRGNVYLGEKVVVHGKLSAKGDLDVGDDVEIKEGFRVKGWINIRSPIPVVIYIFIYLMQLLKLGRSEEIERILSELEKNEDGVIPVSQVFLFVPTNAVLGLQHSKADTSVMIGRNCRVLGNFTGSGDVHVGGGTVIHGSIFSKGSIYLDESVEIHGGLSSDKDVFIDDNCILHGNINAERVFLSKTATVEGNIFGKKGVMFGVVKGEKMDEKLKRFEVGADVVDEVGHMLE
ncbi:MAG TPA: hypothetical protein ENI42_03675 [Thermoplasmatales archaeon]|nr:hypothetical protein [Thermoplasmatales archaeon]